MPAASAAVLPPLTDSARTSAPRSRATCAVPSLEPSSTTKSRSIIG